MYGLPKIHKQNLPFRPIFRACGTATYSLAKYLIPLLSPITENEFTVKNSYEFARDVNDLKLSNGMVMASFDVKSLFTNTHVQETINFSIARMFIFDVSEGIADSMFLTIIMFFLDITK